MYPRHEAFRPPRRPSVLRRGLRKVLGPTRAERRHEALASLDRAFLAMAIAQETSPPSPPYHDAARCAPEPCPWHRPSDHSMREWPILLRSSGLTERTCPHGVGHPDPDSEAWLDRIDPENAGAWGIHGCDGCCS